MQTRVYGRVILNGRSLKTDHFTIKVFDWIGSKPCWTFADRTEIARECVVPFKMHGMLGWTTTPRILEPAGMLTVRF